MGLSHNKLYRNFIILQEDQRGYSISKDKALSGYAKVESKGDKCKVSFYAQNLKQEENYSMILICCKKDYKQLIDLGPLSINEVGKADTSKEYYINNIAGLGISYEKISGAAICKTRGGEAGFIMYGFMNGEELTENWRKFKLTKVDNKKSEVIAKNIKVENIDTTTIEKPMVKEISNHATKMEKLNINSENKIKLEPKVDSREEVEYINEIKSKEEIQEKVNIEVKDVERKVANLEDKIKDSQLDISKKIEEDLSEVDRNKDKKCNKYDEKESHKEYKKEKEKEKEKKSNNDMDSVEECIKKLAEKLEDYEGTIDFDMNLDGDFIVWGILKDKSIEGCKWKKFKMNKNQCAKFDKLIERQDNYKRIEENTRRDTLDFEQYEREIQKIRQDNDDFTLKGKVGNYFEDLAKDFKPYNEKLNDINYCKWYKVDVNSIEDLCNQSNYNKYTLAYYPMLNYYPYINKSNYFLLGYKCDQSGELQYIVYGIPGSKDKNEQPFGGKTGFVTWTNDSIGNQGYWLMFYDYKNSSIVVPMK